MPISLSLRGITISPYSMERENEEGVESLAPGAMAQFSPLPSKLTLATSGDLPTEGTPLAKIPDRSPSCPCCGTWIGKISGLIEHLKKMHGK